jgi:hypothetical protein
MSSRQGRETHPGEVATAQIRPRFAEGVLAETQTLPATPSTPTAASALGEAIDPEGQGSGPPTTTQNSPRRAPFSLSPTASKTNGANHLVLALMAEALAIYRRAGANFTEGKG